MTKKEMIRLIERIEMPINYYLAEDRAEAFMDGTLTERKRIIRLIKGFVDIPDPDGEPLLSLEQSEYLMNALNLERKAKFSVLVASDEQKDYYYQGVDKARDKVRKVIKQITEKV